MTKAEIQKILNEMITIADNLLFNFTIFESDKINIDEKQDKTPVTTCDKLIDDKLTIFAHQYGFKVISEEGPHVEEILKSGNYMTIDPIDGTLGYIDYYNKSLQENDLSLFGKRDYGPEHDFCLLIGIVENNIPKYGAVYNYVTKETIILSGKTVSRKNQKREFPKGDCIYVDKQVAGKVEDNLREINDLNFYIESALGLKSIYSLVNGHTNSVCLHRVQRAGLWDIMPAMVFATANNDIAIDDFGDPIKLDSYIYIPGKGVTFIHGSKFKYIQDEIKNIPNEFIK